MDIYDSLFSSNVMLNEQIATELFGIMDQQDLILAILDGQGNCWCSNEEKFSELLSHREQLSQLCSRVDDGDDPVITQIEEFSVVGTEFVVGDVNFGYLVVFFPQSNPESTLANMDIIDLMLNQVALIGRLIDKNNKLHLTQLKQLSGVCVDSSVTRN